jgi:hypothetical protein
MSYRSLSLCFAAAFLTAGTIAYSQAAGTPKNRTTSPQTPAAKPAANDADLIKSAMAAAPLEVAKDATIVNGEMKVIRQGTNGWTCMPDLPTSPGTDPMCLDKNAMDWAHALMAKKDPPKGKMGIGYMLMGGSDASKTDPFATKPAAGGKWIDTGPHLMVLNIGDMFAGYPMSATNTKAPYVMFAGTPYAHLMIPVK